MSEITKPADIESAIEKFSDSQVTPYIKPYDFERQVANDFKSKRGRRIGRVVLGSAAAALVAVGAAEVTPNGPNPNSEYSHSAQIIKQNEGHDILTSSNPSPSTETKVSEHN